MKDKLPKRRNVFIKKGFQGRLILGVFGIILLAGLCSALLIYWLTGSDLEAQSLSMHAAVSSVSERLGASVVIGSLVSMLVAGIVTVISVLYATHKIAGPLYRFETLCRQIGNGNLDGITQLREKDQLKALALAFSEMVGKLREQRGLRSEVVATIYDQLSVLQGSSNLTQPQQEAVEKILDALQGFEP